VNKGEFMEDKKLDTSVSTEAKKLNGTQRIEILERQVIKLGQLIDQQVVILAKEIDTLREVIVKLNQRINATIQAGEGGSLSNDVVDNIMIKNDIKKMETDVEYLVKSGVLKKDNETPATENTFVVGRNVDKEGNIVNPRLQFAISTLENEEIKKMFIGAIVGNVIKAQVEGDSDIEITELYSITQPEKDIDFDKNKE
jgi:hypothetical protein